MFHSAAAHDGFIFKFQGPAFLSHVEYDGFHAQVLCSDLGAQAGSHTGVQEQQTNALAGSQ
jgi:hypothetical protein